MSRKTDKNKIKAKYSLKPRIIGKYLNAYKMH